MTVSTKVIKLLLARINLPYVEIKPGHRLQVIRDLDALPYCQRNQYAAFVASAGTLVVWADEPGDLLRTATLIQDSLMQKIWMKDSQNLVDEKRPSPLEEPETSDSDSLVDEEKDTQEPRRTKLIQPFASAATLIIAFAALGAGCSKIALATFVDHNWIRMAFALVFIPQLWLSLVSSQITSGVSKLLTLVVLFPGVRRERAPAPWPCRTDKREFQMLFREGTAKAATQERATACDCANASLRRRPLQGDCAHFKVSEISHKYI
jgi:hypothetical protein